jgi:hypothetical protein
MRAKDLDSVLPRVNYELTDGDDLVIDGARTKLVNGAITQNGLELIERLRQDKKDLEAVIKAAEARIVQAIKDGVDVQNGNRRAKIKVTERTNPKYKDKVEALLGYTVKDDPKRWEKEMASFCSTSKTEKLEID